MFSQTRRRWLGLGLLMALVLSACATQTPLPTEEVVPSVALTQEIVPTATAVPSKLTFAFSPSPSFSMEAIALQKGYFAEEGLDVTVVTFATGREALQAVLGGAAQVGTAAATPIVFAGFQDQPVAVIADTGRNAASKITARVASGIKTAADLRGKKIGVPVGTDLHYFLDVYLNANGMSEADVEVVNVAPPDMVASLSRGDIDAMSIWEPNPWKAKQELGDQVIFLTDPPNLYTAHYLLVTTQDWASQNPDVVVKFLKAIAKAEAFLRNNPAEGQELVANETQSPLDMVRGVWDGYEFGLELTPALITQMQRQAQWAIDTGRAPAGVTSMPDYAKLAYVAGLKEVKPEAVTLP